MADPETTGTGPLSAEAPAGKARRKTARRAAGTRPRKRSAGKGASPRRRKTSSRRRPATFTTLLKKLTSTAAQARAGAAAISGESASAARRALSQAVDASRNTVNRLNKEWKRMDSQKKARVVAAVLGALAAASAPFVRSRLRRK